MAAPQGNLKLKNPIAFKDLNSNRPSGPVAQPGRRSMEPQIAEIAGAILGDGCISHYWDSWSGYWRYELAFTGHLHDEAYYNNVVQPIICKHFSVKGSLRLRKSDNTVRYHVRSPRVCRYFCELGIPVGKKPDTLDIPYSIKANDRLLEYCIRGLFDTEGSVYRRYSKQYANHPKIYDHYAVIQLRMRSFPILLTVKKFLESNSISTTKISEQDNRWTLRIVKQKSVADFVRLVGFSNPYHIKRYLAICGSILLPKAAGS